MKVRKYSFYTAFLLVFLSGVAWLIAHYFLREAGEFGETIHPLEPWSLKLHGAAMMLTLFAGGAMMPGHANLHWRRNRNRIPGILMLLSLLLLVISGWVLYYLANEENHNLIGIIHWGIGLAMLVILLWHRMAGLSSRN